MGHPENQEHNRAVVRGGPPARKIKSKIERSLRVSHAPAGSHRLAGTKAVSQNPHPSEGEGSGTRKANQNRKFTEGCASRRSAAECCAHRHINLSLGYLHSSRFHLITATMSPRDEGWREMSTEIFL